MKIPELSQFTSKKCYYHPKNLISVLYFKTTRINAAANKIYFNLFACIVTEQSGIYFSNIFLLVCPMLQVFLEMTEMFSNADASGRTQ